jgi:hypothetical protein
VPNVSGPIGSVSADTPDDVWAVSPDRSNLVFHWDGRQWSVSSAALADGLPPFLTSIAALGPDDVWAVGYSMPNYSRAIAEHWDGHGWKVLPTPNLGGAVGARFAQVFAQAHADVWAVGWRYFADSQLTLVEHWNGHAWSVVPSPNAGKADENFLQAVAATSQKDVWAAGYHYPPPEGLMGPLIQHWDGDRWSILPSPQYPSDHGLNGLASVGPDDVWAVGSGLRDERFRPLVLHWDGKRWAEAEACNLPGASLTSVAAFQSGDVWAVGQYSFRTKDRLGSRVFIERRSA